MRLGDLAEFVLQRHRPRAVQNAKRPAAEARCVLAEGWTAPSRFNADESNRIVLQHLVEETDGVRSAADARDGDVRNRASSFLQLTQRLAPDHGLEIAYDQWIGMGPEDRADDVVRGADIRDPVADRFIDRVLQGAAAAGDGNDFGAEEAHTEDVHILAGHVDRAPVDDAVEAEERA